MPLFFQPTPASLVRNETPGGSINGSNTAFTTSAVFATGSLKVYLNGQRLTGGGNDYTEGTQGFTMAYAPATGDVLLVDYEMNSSQFIQGSNSSIVLETPSGSVNGSNTVFTTLLGKYVPNTLEVYVNGLQKARGTDYTETTPSSGTFTFTTAPLTNDVVRVCYQFASGALGNADTVDGIHASATPTANTLYPLNANAGLPLSIIDSATGTWSSYTPTITVSSGSFTSVSATGRYSQVGKLVVCSIAITITNNGTAAGFITTTLPVTALGTVIGGAGFGRGDNVSGKSLSLHFQSTTKVDIRNYDGSYPGASGELLDMTLIYEAA